MRQGKVIDADADEQALIVRVRGRFPADVILFRKVQETLPPPLVFRSPRFADALWLPTSCTRCRSNGVLARYTAQTAVQFNGLS